MSLALYSTLPCECHEEFNRTRSGGDHVWQFFTTNERKLLIWVSMVDESIHSVEKANSSFRGVEELPFSILESTWSISVTSRSLDAVTWYSV
jgi:hypothetical protein